jgi:PAS domain S-box-containing protein
MMKTMDHDANGSAALRSRAVAHLKGFGAQAHSDSSAALGVLYELASSPSTAPGALALLHELQVHQVEVDLQSEELRRSRAELELALNRQVQLYDFSPVAYFTVDGEAVLRELNLTGATLLGFERDWLRGRPLDHFLTPEGAATLRAMLAGVARSGRSVCADLHLKAAQDGESRCMHASAGPDPAGGGVLIALIEAIGTAAVFTAE